METTIEDPQLRFQANTGRRHGPQGPFLLDDDENEVPQSLLVELNNERAINDFAWPPEAKAHIARDFGAPRAKQQTTQKANQAHGIIGDENSVPPARAYHPPSVASAINFNSARDKAAWRWVNVSNLDHFILDVYNYYEGSGYWCILVDRGLHLLETTFVTVFLTFLTQCVDHSKISDGTTLKHLLVPHCTERMSVPWSLGLWIYVFYFIWKMVQFSVDLRRLSHLRDFYVHLLGIPEQDMQTVSWQDVVARVMALRDTHAETAVNLAPGSRRYLGSQSKKRLDAHDIANRLMRKENYFIALVNKDVLDFSLPVPLFGRRTFFSRTLEWYLNFVIIDFVFDHGTQVNQEFLKAQRRGFLSAKLRQRFIFAGVLNLIFAPFVLTYILVLYFFNSFLEFKSDPSKIGTRKYTPLAEWKFREFNELPHLFNERVNMSYPFATRYLDQFPKQITERLARTVAFISGALAAVLTLISVIDPEIFRVELTPDRTGLFYIGVLGAIWAFARGRVSEDELVFDPEYAMRNVVEYTHHMPDHWRGRLHSSDVMQEFSGLYKLKWVIFLEEVFGILATPFLLIFTLPNCSDHIVDFFREFTIHVDGLGYVCSFAVFDFKRAEAHKVKSTTNKDAREDYYSTKHGKMAASYYGFLDNYVINPKTGIPGHTPPGARTAFHPPPTFPPLGSSPIHPDAYVPHPWRERERSKGAISNAQQPGGWALHKGVSPTAPSPIASPLLDPHHQPSMPGPSGRSMYRSRTARGARGIFHPEITEMTFEKNNHRPVSPIDRAGQDVLEGGGELDDSMWESSPNKTLSRENSVEAAHEPDIGVLDLIYQFQQAHQYQRPRAPC